jgi:hypothetical protein
VATEQRIQHTRQDLRSESSTKQEGWDFVLQTKEKGCEKRVKITGTHGN